MKPRAIYNSKGWVLARCGGVNVFGLKVEPDVQKCGRANYVEPHGTSSWCPTCNAETEHISIPFSERDAAGTIWLGKKGKRHAQG